MVARLEGHAGPKRTMLAIRSERTSHPQLLHVQSLCRGRGVMVLQQLQRECPCGARSCCSTFEVDPGLDPNPRL